MGNDSSKKKESSLISAEQKKCITNLLGPQKTLPQENLQVLWSDKMSEGLRHTFLCYLFRNTKVLSVAEFELFFHNLCEGSLDDQAKTLVQLIGSQDYVLYNDLQKYVSDMLESYVLILKTNATDVYNSWNSGESAVKDDIRAISTFLIKDIKQSDGKIYIDELESWLNQTSLLKEINRSVVNTAFGIKHEKLRPALPKANKSTNLLSVASVLVLTHFTRLKTKNWRLLYSSSIEPHSWQIFSNKLFKEGPTLVILRDKEDGNIFGGFASQSWKITPGFYGDDDCFLFRLRPEFRLCLPTGYNENFQYINSGAATLPNGLGMGGQLNYFGFFLDSEFGPATVSKSCTTFRDYVPLAAEENFSFSLLEVWAIGEKDIEEEGVRQVGVTSSGLVMDRDREALAILEMAGKAGHAKAAGEDTGIEL